jgi:hypothetical protein
MAINRIDARCRQAEEEYPQLAAPDGTVAVQIDDLRALLNAYDQVLLDCNKAQQLWAARWYGSPPMRGSTLMTLTEHGSYGQEIAYFGDADGVHKLVSHVAFLHNQALNESNPNRLLSEKQPSEVVRQMRASLAYYDYLLPGDWLPEPPLRKSWFRWKPSFEVTQDLVVWAGTVARARSLMDLEAAASAIEARSAETGNTDSARQGESAAPEEDAHE